MNRLISILLTIIMVLALCACGNTSTLADTPQAEQKASDDVSSEQPDPAIQEPAAEDVQDSKNRTIVIDPACVAIDDENIKVEIVSVSSKAFNEGKDSEFIQFCVNLVITNKNSEYEVDVGVPNGYGNVGSYTVNFANGNCTTRAGKINDTAYYCCTIYPNDHSRDTKGAEHIETLEDLLLFNAEFHITLRSFDGSSYRIVEQYKAQFSLEEALANRG